MKKIFSFIFFIISFYSNAQINFPAHGADWHYMIHNGGFSGPDYYTNTEMKYIQDTLIQNKTAAAVSGTWPFNFGGQTDTSYFYSSNDTVFFYNSTTLNRWQNLYCFNAVANQSWNIYLQDIYGIDSINVYVDSTAYININAHSLKALYVTYNAINHFGAAGNSSPNSHHSVVYDRIGDINAFLNFTSDGLATCDGCPYEVTLLCYQDSSFALYQPDSTKNCNYYTSGINPLANNYQISIYPNPTTSTIRIQSSSSLGTISVYNTLGQLITQQTTKENNTEIDLSKQSAGFYLVKIGTSFTKVVKQ